MLCAVVILGINQKAYSSFAMTTLVLVQTPEGARPALALIDSGAEANFAS